MALCARLCLPRSHGSRRDDGTMPSRAANSRERTPPPGERGRERTPPKRERRREQSLLPRKERRREGTPTPRSRLGEGLPTLERSVGASADEDIRLIGLGLVSLVTEFLFIRASDVFGAFGALQRYDPRPILLRRLPDAGVHTVARHFSERYGLPLVTADVRGPDKGEPLTFLAMRRQPEELASFPSFRDRLHALVRPCTILALETLWDLYSVLWHDVPSEAAFRERLDGEHRGCCTRKAGKSTYKVNSRREPVRRLAAEEARERSPPRRGGYKGVVVHERQDGASAMAVLVAGADLDVGPAAPQNQDTLLKEDVLSLEMPSLGDNDSFASEGDGQMSESGGGSASDDRPPPEPVPLQEDDVFFESDAAATDGVDGGLSAELELAWLRVRAMPGALVLEDFNEAVWRYWDLAPGDAVLVQQRI